jgi:hypothetical protein
MTYRARCEGRQFANKHRVAEIWMLEGCTRAIARAIAKAPVPGFERQRMRIAAAIVCLDPGYGLRLAADWPTAPRR